MHGNLHGLTMAAGQPAPKKDTKYIEALFEKRIEYVKQLRSALEEPTSVASQTVAAYTDLLDGETFASSLHLSCILRSPTLSPNHSKVHVSVQLLRMHVLHQQMPDFVPCMHRAPNRHCCGSTSERQHRPGAAIGRGHRMW